MTEMHTLKSGSCPTLSGSSTLAYAVGIDAQTRTCISITGASGGGLYSGEPVPFKDIQNALKKSDPITSSALREVFTSRSSNTPGFLLAVLVKEKLVEPLPDKMRHFRLLDPAPFLERVAKLKQSAKPVASNPAKKPAAKKVPPKKKAKK